MEFPFPAEHDTLLTLLAAFATLSWSFFKSSAWFQRLREQRIDQALQILEAAVEETYRTYVRAIKEGRADGKLSPEEQRRARELAKLRAFAIARSRGVPLLRALGEPLLDLWIYKLVRNLKRP